MRPPCLGAETRIERKFALIVFVQKKDAIVWCKYVKHLWKLVIVRRKQVSASSSSQKSVSSPHKPVSIEL